MKTRIFLIMAFALCLTACGKQNPADVQPAANEPVTEEARVPTFEFDEAFVNHMHEHAAKLDDLMLALADGDLMAAATPAYWLSQHDTVEGVPEEWQNYVTSMRNAAYEVETATDLDTARAAAEDISAQCQGCHTAAGVDVPE